MVELSTVVSGGGVVGLAAALTLSRSHHSVVLLDQPSPSTMGTRGIDLRSSALSPASIEFLADLGFSDDRTGVQINAMHVWERDGTASITFEAHEVDAMYLAKVFPNCILVEALQELVEADTRIRVANENIEAIDPSARLLKLNDGTELECELLVVAEGANSQTANLIDVKRHRRSLNQHAMVSVLGMSKPHDGSAWQRFGDTPIALLPYVEENVVSLIWSISDTELESIRSLDDLAFAQKVTEATEGLCGEVESVDRRLSFPLLHSYVEDMNPLGWTLIVGDAARTIHPLAGQGVNLGIEDIRAMARVLETDPPRLDESSMWSDFAARRKLRSLMMLALMRGFSEVWQAHGPFFRLLRNFGVRSIANTTIVRHQLMREAMGLAPIARSL